MSFWNAYRLHYRRTTIEPDVHKTLKINFSGNQHLYTQLTAFRKLVGLAQLVERKIGNAKAAGLSRLSNYELLECLWISF